MIFIIIIIIIIIMYYFTLYKIVEHPDGECYKVINYRNYKEAANKLSDINKFIVDVLRNIKNDKHLLNILNNYKPDKLIETNPNNLLNLTSYTYYNGNVMSICLRNYKGEFIDDNLIKFVVLHEITHQAEDTPDHDHIYWKLFKKILICADGIHGFKNIDYGKYPEYYCNIHVNYNPFYDINL